MPNSLKTKINNLRFRNRITEEEHKTLIRKLQGHDQELYARAYSAGLKDGLDITLDATCDVIKKMVLDKSMDWYVGAADGRTEAVITVEDLFKILEEVSGSDKG